MANQRHLSEGFSLSALLYCSCQQNSLFFPGYWVEAPSNGLTSIIIIIFHTAHLDSSKY